MANVYYDLAIKRIPTAARFSAVDGEPLGFDVSPASEDDLAAMRADCAAQGDGPAAVTAEVIDNGRHGDGLWLSFFPCARATGDAPLFSIELELDQANTLCEALMAAVRMRATERD